MSAPITRRDALRIAAGISAAACLSGRAEDPKAKPEIDPRWEAKPVLGPSFEAAAVKVDDAWNVTFRTPPDKTKAQTKAAADKGEVDKTFPLGEFARWGKPSDDFPRRARLLLLVNGDRLPFFELSAVDAEGLTVDSSTFGEVRIPRRETAAVVFAPPSDWAARERLVAQLMAGESLAAGPPLTPGGEAVDLKRDQLFLVGGDRLAGDFQGLSSTMDGPATVDGRPTRRETAKLSTDFGPLEVDVSRAVALRFRSVETPAPAADRTIVAAGFSDGTQLTVDRLTFDGFFLSLRPLHLRGGKPWEAIDRRAAAGLCFLQPLNGRSVYLSDLKPALYRQAPYLNVERNFTADASLSGGPLRCGGRTYLKGLSAPTAGMLVYALDGRAEKFAVEVGVDDSVLGDRLLGDSQLGRSSVEFRVLLDNVEHARVLVRSGAPAQSLEVDLRGARRLMLFVGFGDHGDVLDHACWLDPRLVKPSG